MEQPDTCRRRGRHPTTPQSNIAQVESYHPDEYTLGRVNLTIATSEDLTPGVPPFLTQRSIAHYLRPLTRKLDEVPPRPTIDELPDAVINRMVERDKAFWVDKPGLNAYEMHDLFDRCGLSNDKVLPPHQDVFPRSYQYDLDCVKYRRFHACDPMNQPRGTTKKEPAPYCRNCRHFKTRPALTPFQLSVYEDTTQKRWRYYPDLKATLTQEEIQAMMSEVGRPFRNEACTWYNKNYPSAKFDIILRKFSK